jgi:hypothetical protein
MRKIIAISAIGILCIIVPQIQASLIEIAIEAKVTGVDDPGGLLEGNVNIGDIITGSYKYETEAFDAEPANPYKGLYKFTQLPYGVFLEVNGYRFKTNLSNVDFKIGLINDKPPLNSDTYWFDSYNNVMVGTDIPMGGIFWQLDDDSGQAISSINLQVTAPIVNDWLDGNILSIGGGVEIEATFGISAQVNSTTLIPEPSSLILISLGLIYLRNRK